MAEILAQFIEITSADEVTARNLLEACGNNLELAVSMFMESGPQLPSAAASHSSHGAGNGGGFDDPRQHSTDSDAQDHHPGGEVYVRPPDAVKRQRLMDLEGGMGRGPSVTMGHPMLAAAMSMGMGGYSRQDHAARSTAFSGADSDNKEALNPHSKKLKALFAPPTDIMFEGVFMAAREAAKKQNMWLLVNIQDDKEFASHQLNRDFWNDDTVQATVASTCVFWQEDRTSPEGKFYCNRYKTTSFPHVAIIDPRTGGEVWVWPLPTEAGVDAVSNAAHKITEQLMDRGAVGSTDHKAVLHELQKQGSSGGGGSSANGDAREEAELKAALAASKADGGYSGSDADENGQGETSGDEVELVDAPPPPQAKDPLDDVEVRDEPPAGTLPAAVAKVQIILANGTKRRRSFYSDDPVKVVFRYARDEQAKDDITKPEDAKTNKNRTFDLSAPQQGPMAGGPSSLKSQWEETIQAAKLGGCTLRMIWKD